MKYKGYTIEKGDYGYWEFVHEEYDGAPETYASEFEQTPSTDKRCGHAKTLCDAKLEIDELIEEEESE